MLFSQHLQNHLTFIKDVMNHYLVKNSQLKGSIQIPGSKSQTLRAILFGAMGTGKTLIHRPLDSPDSHAMIQACRLFGAKIDVYPEKLEIEGLNGRIQYTEDVINAGNSGIVLRFCAGIGALATHPIVITGDESIRHQRPMKELLKGLSQLGVITESMRGDDYAPVIITGPIKPGKTTISGRDSQPVSSILIAAAFSQGPIELIVQEPGETPWIAMTLNWFDRLGISYKNEDYEHYHLFGNSRYDGFEYQVPGDLSSAAFPIAAALITHSGVTIKNVDMSDSQGDKELITTFQKMGAIIEIDEENKMIQVKKGGVLHGLKVDINDFIDAITILAVVACFAEGETLIYNAAIARQKECNRIHCIATELRKMGATIVETEDGLSIQKSSLKGAQVYSYNDHRMAMSLSVAGFAAQGITTISSIDCVAKTFPTFMKDLQALGADIQVKT